MKTNRSSSAIHSLRPFKHLQTVGKAYPEAWKRLEMFLRSKGKDDFDWPNWCFLPMGGWYAIVSAEKFNGGSIGINYIGDVGCLAAIGTWRYCQGIYRFDEDLQAALIDTELTGDLPVEVIRRLPEYCIYVETPGIFFSDLQLHGFWCHLEHDFNNGRGELRLLLDTESELMPIPIHLGDWSLLEAIRRADRETLRHAPPGLPIGLYQQERVSELQPLLSMLLYLCSDAPEIDDEREPGSRPYMPQPKKTRNGWRLFPPDRPRIWQVGHEIGVKLRSSLATEHREKGHAVRSHIRRPHWHGYWTGPRAKERKFIYRWIPALLVGR